MSNTVISIDELWKFFNLSESLFCVAGRNGSLKHVNPAVTVSLGYSEQKLLDMPFKELIYPEDKPLMKQKIRKLVSDNSVTGSSRFLTKSGDFKWLHWTATSNKDGKIYVVAIDCTEKTILQAQLFAERIDKEKKVMEASIYAQEVERVEIGKELHDNINQLLGAAKLYQEMALKDKKMSEEYLQQSKEILGEAIEEIRHLSKSLVASSFKEFTLSDSIENLVHTIVHARNIKINFYHEGLNEDLPIKLKLTIFRIIQEQLNNVIKHAEAKNVEIKIIIDNENLSLTVRDDGKGFDQSEKRNGIGLTNIINRTEILNGKVILTSAIHKGCKLTVRIPACQLYQLN